jgi:hypothetical protein
MNKAKLSSGNWAVCIDGENPVELIFDCPLAQVTINWSDPTKIVVDVNNIENVEVEATKAH